MRIASILILLALSILLIGCGSNPNEHVQSNEFFRQPSDTQASADQSAAQDSQQAQQDDQQAQAEADATAESDQQADQPQAAQAQQQSDQSDQSDQSGQPDQADEADQDDEPDAPLETSSDVVRRYNNPSYGYSFDLVCSPFCDPNSNGIDRVSFLSETGRALIGVDVVIDDESDLGDQLRANFALPDNVEFTVRSTAATVTGEPAERFDWDEDRRATGGFQVRWHALVVRVDELVVILRAGAVIEDYEAIAPALERALGSFILPIELGAQPGRYDRFDYLIEYDPDDVAQEFGQPTNNPPADESGIFVLQSASALKAVLTWQTLGAAFYDGDAAIQQSLSDSLGIESINLSGDYGEVDGQVARTGETETQFGEGLMQIQSFAWYCPDSGREFALHVLDRDDPLAVALPLLESFRCSAD